MKTRWMTGTMFLLLLSSCDGKKEAGEKERTPVIQEDKPVPVKVTRLEYTDFSYELIANGVISAARKAELRFQSQGIVEKIHVRNGQRVAKGQKIAELDKFKLEMDLKQADEALERASLDLQDVLIGQGYAIADSAAIPDDVMRIAGIRSNHEQARTSYTIARHNLDAATLHAPFPGVVANLTGKEFNEPGTGAFCTVIDDHSLEVVFNILENELPLTGMNDKVIVSPFSRPDHAAEGRVSEINPVIDKNGRVRVKATLHDAKDVFREGMNVKIRVQRLLGKRLVIPKSALVSRANRKVVFTLKDGRANWVYVETAQENSGSHVVTDGLHAGDSVIYTGNLNLAHETPVAREE
ncbi:MAG: efflux RND transporter periplasmic adaptor subunit [Odoribacteraceae bacterium]|jgi:RND family efflux transporter MFP subunit|nr:efflux RND transporter periplasmic adaptor subunit [Odoribacteraceae bacterium]